MTEATLAVGSDAPDFDLTSTEDVLLMLRDEVPRTALVLYVFLDIDDATHAELKALAAEVPRWSEEGVKVLAMAPIKVAQLKQLQAELELPFPLLEDDRDFCARYGVEAPESTSSEADESSEAAQPEPPCDHVSRRLVLVDRHGKVAWRSEGWNGLGEALAGLNKSKAIKQPPLTNYPGQVINKLVNWWIN